MARLRADPVQNFVDGLQTPDRRSSVMNWPPSRLIATLGKAGRDAFSVPEGSSSTPEVGGVDAPRDRPSVVPKSRATAARTYIPILDRSDWRRRRCCWLQAAWPQPAASRLRDRFRDVRPVK